MRNVSIRMGLVAMALAGVMGGVASCAEPAGLAAGARGEEVEVGAQEAGQWSEAVKGLRARVVIKQVQVMNGTLILAPYLELRNVSDRGNPMKFAWSVARETVGVVDAEKRPLAQGGMAYDGMVVPKVDLLLPRTGSMSFSLASGGAGIPADEGGLMDLGVSHVFVFKRDGKGYFFQLAIEIPERDQENADRTWAWDGRIEVPAVKVPLTIPKMEGKAAGKAIEEWGPKLLAKNSRESEEARRVLSLIEDERVIPWYVKAVGTDNSDLKFMALDRLGRMKGDEALAGLKVGMGTRGKDMGNSTTAQVAEQGAENIRHAAALALGRSPHPDAKRLLMTMAEDSSKAVRVTVVQRCAAMDTAEGWAIVRKATGDGDEMVRGEAARLWKGHEGGK